MNVVANPDHDFEPHAAPGSLQDRKESLWQLYRSEHEMFRASAYRAGLCEPLWAELDQLLGGSAFDPQGEGVPPDRPDQ